MDVGGIILAGGNSVRMGTDKGVLKLGSKTLTELSYENIKPFVRECIIVSNNIENQIVGCKTIPDEIKNTGPLGGLYTGLLHSIFENNLVISCDTPFIRTFLFSEILNQAVGFDAVILKEKKRIHPLIGLYGRALLPKMKQKLDTRTYKMMQLLEEINFKTINSNLDKNANFANINTPDIFDTAQQFIKRSTWHKR